MSSITSAHIQELVYNFALLSDSSYRVDVLNWPNIIVDVKLMSSLMPYAIGFG